MMVGSYMYALGMALVMSVGGSPPPPYTGPVTLCATIPRAAPGDTFLVTMAAVNASNPAMIYSTFAAGVPVNITRPDQLVCLDWDGLDDNFMPVVPGTYATKAIAMPSRVWPVDGKPHAIVAEFAAAALPFAPKPAAVAANATGFFFHVIGDPVGSSMGAVTVDSGSNTAVFYHEYLENARNNFVVNLTAEIGWAQCTNRFDSGGAAGGNATTTDGTTVWSYSSNGGSVVYRPDQQPWGSCHSAYRHNVFCPQGVLAGLSSARNTRLNTSKHGFTTVVMVATRKATWIPGSADQVAFVDGYDSGAKVLAKVALPNVVAIDVRDGWVPHDFLFWRTPTSLSAFYCLVATYASSPAFKS